MDIIGQSSERYRQQLQQDPLTNLAASVGLQVNSPEAEQKLRFMGQAVAQQAAQFAQIQQADNVSKAMTGWKQSQFAGRV
jgi:hypothetical protein